jgi:hypothetical protein
VKQPKDGSKGREGAEAKDGVVGERPLMWNPRRKEFLEKSRTKQFSICLKCISKNFDPNEGMMLKAAVKLRLGRVKGDLGRWPQGGIYKFQIDVETLI